MYLASDSRGRLCSKGARSMPELNKVAMFTNEYPPNVYGGAGVHVEYLSRELARLVAVEVRCFGDQDIEKPNLRVKGYGSWPAAKQNTDPRFGGALDAFYRSLSMAKDTLDAGVVHAVSQETRNDVLRFFPIAPEKIHVIHNGIDLQQYRKNPATDALVKRGVDPSKPFVLFVGRITRQKGIIHLVNAIPDIDPSLQVVLCARAPDTKEIGQEMTERVAEVSRDRADVIWR